MSYKVEKVNPYDTNQPKNEQVARMFNEIAPNYDKLNGTLSMGIDTYWRKDALKQLKKYNPNHILDIATGTGDFAILAQQMLKPEKISAVDISDGMMEIGKIKVDKKGMSKTITFENQDCSAMTFNDKSFDDDIVAFGVRNFENIDKSFQEVLRVLKPGGVFLFLELTTPEKSPMKQFYAFYTKHVIPFLTGLFATEQRAYKYLPASIAAFPQGKEMMSILEKNGFTRIRIKRYTMGICSLYIAEKPIV